MWKVNIESLTEKKKKKIENTLYFAADKVVINDIVLTNVITLKCCHKKKNITIFRTTVILVLRVDSEVMMTHA